MLDFVISWVKLSLALFSLVKVKLELVILQQKKVNVKLELLLPQHYQKPKQQINFNMQ